MKTAKLFLLTEIRILITLEQGYKMKKKKRNLEGIECENLGVTECISYSVVVAKGTRSFSELFKQKTKELHFILFPARFYTTVLIALYSLEQLLANSLL